MPRRYATGIRLPTLRRQGHWAHPRHDDDEEGKSEEGEPEHEEEDGEEGGGKNKIAKTEIDLQFLLSHLHTQTHTVQRRISENVNDIAKSKDALVLG